MNSLNSVMRAEAAVSALKFIQTRMDFPLMRRIQLQLGVWQQPSKNLLLTLLDHIVGPR